MSVMAGDLASALDPVRFAGGLGFAAEGWQSRLLRSRAARALVACSRQVGKSTTVGYRALHTAVYNEGRDVLVISPTQRQSDELLLRVASLYRAMPDRPRLKRDNASEMTLQNGARIVSLPGSEGGIRGFANVKLLILDEAARIEDDVFASAVPMVGSDGQIVALSTPWGRRGWFFDLHEDPLNGWERHRVTVHESAQWPASRIAEVRSAVGGFVFASDYLAEFGDTDTQLFSSESVRAAFSGAVAPLEVF